MADKNFKVKSGLQVPSLTTAGPVVTDNAGNVTSSATLPISQGGTGQTTAGNALNALLPLQTSQDNKYLQTNGVSTQWTTVLQPIYSADAPSNPITGQIWVESDVNVTTFDQNLIRRKTITATAGQTVFTADYAFVDAYEQVFLNGILLVRTSDYTTNGATNTVTLIQGASAGDILEIVSITNLNTINAATTTTNTFTGTQTIANSGEWPVRIVSTGATSTNRAHFISQRSNNGGAVTSGFTLGGLSMSGHDGTNYGLGWNGGAEITAYAAENWTSSARGTHLAFFNTANGTNSVAERMRINSAGNVGIGTTAPGQKLSVNGSMDAIHEDGANMAIRIRANASNGSGNLQFTNNAATSDWAYIGSPSAGKLVLRTPGGASNTFYDSWLSINGGPVIIRDVLSNNAEATDWPVPTLALQSHDDYFENTMFGMFLRDDNPYTLDFSKWVMRLSHGYGQLTSNSSTNLKFGGPGDLVLFTGNSEKMRLRSDGHLWLGSSGDANWHLAVADSTANAGAFLSTTTTNALAGLFEVTKSDYSNVILKLGANRTATSAYTFIQALSGASADTEFNIRGDGQAYADGSWNSGGADYAEYFEWADGNPENEDRRGYSVSLIGKKIKLAEEGEVVIGVISGNPSIVGDAGWNSWNNKYLLDDFGSYIKDEDGHRISNPEFDPEQEYVSREDRPEWAIVGLMGKLRLRKGQPVASNWIKMDDISAEVEEWLVK